jgi:DNA-binding NarL/FixJ family response regulator
MALKHASRFDGAILVADDHAVTRFGLIQLFRDALAADRIFEAQTFSEALDRLRDASIRLAIFDLGMPGLDSPMNLAQVRKARPDIKVVVLSASERRTDILAALDAGVHGYLVKSANMDRLVSRIQHVLAGEIYVPSSLAELPCADATPRFAPTGAVMAPNAPMNGNGDEISVLSDRQRQVLEGLMMGLSNKQIARELDLAEGTVKMHVGALFRTLGAQNRTHAVALGKKLLDAGR